MNPSLVAHFLKEAEESIGRAAQEIGNHPLRHALQQAEDIIVAAHRKMQDARAK